MTRAVRVPSRELRRLAVRINAGCDHFQRERGDDVLDTRWEAMRHAWSLSNLSLRYTEAVVLMARTDVALLPAAWCAARAAVEATARCLWLLDPDNVWEREARWLALVEEGARLGERPEMKSSPHFVAESAKIREFSREVADKLPDGVVVPRTPTVAQMLKVHGEEFLRFYAMSSQYAHAAELSTRQWRANFGVDAAYGEYADDQGWILPLLNSWTSFRATVIALLQVQDRAISAHLSLLDQQIVEGQDQFIRSAGRTRG